MGSTVVAGVSRTLVAINGSAVSTKLSMFHERAQNVYGNVRPYNGYGRAIHVGIIFFLPVNMPLFLYSVLPTCFPRALYERSISIMARHTTKVPWEIVFNPTSREQDYPLHRPR